MSTLQERQKKYEDSYDYKFLPKLPIVVRTEIKNFSRLTKNLEKPYNEELLRILRSTMLSTIMDLESALISYNYNSEISFVLKSNKLSTVELYSNRVQKINSTVTSLASINFLKNFLASDDPPDILGEALFETTVFAVPTLSEAFNYLLGRQHQAMNHSLSAVSDLDADSNLNYNSYPDYFKFGSVCYKTPKIVVVNNKEMIKKKWHLDINIGNLLTNKEKVTSIIKNGYDGFELERDLHLNNSNVHLLK